VHKCFIENPELHIAGAKIRMRGSQLSVVRGTPEADQRQAHAFFGFACQERMRAVIQFGICGTDNRFGFLRLHGSTRIRADDADQEYQKAGQIKLAFNH
jgi:hypothetical protein